MQDIHHSGRVKELLAQEITHNRSVEKSIQQERSEKQRQVPFYLQINCDVLESIYFTSAMITSMPLIAAHFMEQKRKVPKPLKRFLEFYEKQVFIGPSKSAKDFVMLACKNMMTGNWQAVTDAILSIKSWDTFSDVLAIKKMLQM